MYEIKTEKYCRSKRLLTYVKNLLQVVFSNSKVVNFMTMVKITLLPRVTLNWVMTLLLHISIVCMIVIS